MLSALRHPRFARLYAAQTVSQIGDALTWIGLALLAYQLTGGKDAAVVLGVALTLRVLAFVVFSPLAGVLADRINRKWVLVACDFGRVVVIGLLPLVNAVWQVYVLMFDAPLAAEQESALVTRITIQSIHNTPARCQDRAGDAVGPGQFLWGV